MITPKIKQLFMPLMPLVKGKPDFLMVGVQRAATTSLYQYLIQHPQIIVSHPHRETYYFNVAENYQKGYGWYIKHFPNKVKKGDRLTFECSPSYLWDADAPERIYNELGPIKLIVILRNPVDRAYSAWQMYRSYQQLSHLQDRADYRSFSQAIAEELGEHPSTTSYPYGYLSRGHYAQQLENYYRYFKPAQILILEFSDLIDNLASNLNQLCDFLNIDPFEADQLTKLSQQKFASAPYRQTPEDSEILDRLNAYFVPFNQSLYHLLGKSYGW
ncbi:MAG: hypothetical protein RLZZ490_1509 [Cyanobacteriota bacterium]|jgi:hypothetical protein